MSFLLLAVGLALTIIGGDLLVRGGSRLALILGLSPLVIGLTIVAMGTSAPELAVSIKAALAGTTSLITGNVVGSNIANILLVLGGAAMVRPLEVSRQVIRVEVPVMIAISVLAWALGSDGSYTWFDGSLFIAVFVGYTLFWFLLIQYRQRQIRRKREEGKRAASSADGESKIELEPRPSTSAAADPPGSDPADRKLPDQEAESDSESLDRSPDPAQNGLTTPDDELPEPVVTLISEAGEDAPDLPGGRKGKLFVVNSIYLLVGVALLFWGSQLAVEHAVILAAWWGVSELVIGLTLIALGTSLPELVASIIACLRGQTGMAVGNALGSNLINIMGVLGLSSMFTSAGVEVEPIVIRFDLPIMLAVALICIPIFRRRFLVTRAEGAALFTGYLVYMAAIGGMAAGWFDPAILSAVSLSLLGLAIGWLLVQYFWPLIRD